MERRRAKAAAPIRSEGQGADMREDPDAKFRRRMPTAEICRLFHGICCSLGCPGGTPIDRSTGSVGPPAPGGSSIVGIRTAQDPADVDARALGARLRRARQIAGLTMGEVGRRLAISVVEVSDYERGRRQPSDDMLDRLARLGVDPSRVAATDPEPISIPISSQEEESTPMSQGHKSESAFNSESTFGAVSRVLAQETGKVPGNVLVMRLIDAVRDTTPPPREVTIGMLAKILHALSPSPALDDWAARSAQEIVQILSKHPAVQDAATRIDNEQIWCMLEGTIAGMLLRVCAGQDLDEAK
jgi:transcriptional regulator with XRE-family HTH domain